MVKKIKGLRAKNFYGYRPVWEMGRAADAKKNQKIVGVNRPGT
ncbi:hypothetical protein SAMN05660649_00509 [Desulfotomaculum arcticum]|uniref:Uncharacterized protein n=1 Tax=Desulfotruncus arcticus DSM 17038 TaxID=1121424 RepID=A0A1I2NEP4_9FIRM|nr:hypothetical protein [Desulfotruncus arcticus]SFG02053.1 hypothetical protein SAMN05660649_00509 [Desulfotomaculum arcticum] [Desulfotruncus arcticus DSM 17038]